MFCLGVLLRYFSLLHGCCFGVCLYFAVIVLFVLFVVDLCIVCGYDSC